jgi:hypothetical protein
VFYASLQYGTRWATDSIRNWIITRPSSLGLVSTDHVCHFEYPVRLEVKLIRDSELVSNPQGQL